MSYHDLLMMYGSEQESAEQRIYIYCQNPKAMKTTKDVEYRDRSAAQDIARLEKLIDDLKDYRQALAARYAQRCFIPIPPQTCCTVSVAVRNSSI